MRRNLKAAAVVALLSSAALLLAACGSGADSTTVQRPPVSAATADRLSKLSDRIATDLATGDTCHAAHAADDLKSAVEGSDLPATLRPGVDAAAGRLVDQVNCPPPPPPPEPEKKKKHDEGDQHHHGGEPKPEPPGHSHKGGFVPPGHAKLKGEE
jgi:hypothetical protein